MADSKIADFRRNSIWYGGGLPNISDCNALSLALSGVKPRTYFQQAIRQDLDPKGVLYVEMKHGHIVRVFMHKSVLEEIPDTDTCVWLRYCSGLYISGHLAPYPLATGFWVIYPPEIGTKYNVHMVMPDAAIERILKLAAVFDIHRLNFVPRPNLVLILEATGDNLCFFMEPKKLCAFVIALSAKLFDKNRNKAKPTVAFGVIVQTISFLSILRKLCGIYTADRVQQYSRSGIGEDVFEILYGLFGCYNVEQQKPIYAGTGQRNNSVCTTVLLPEKIQDFSKRYNEWQRQQEELFHPVVLLCTGQHHVLFPFPRRPPRHFEKNLNEDYDR